MKNLPMSKDLNEPLRLSTQSKDFAGGSDSKASDYNAGDLGSIPGLGRSPGEGNGNPLQYSCLENIMDGGAWQATIHGVTKSWIPLSDFTSLSLGQLLELNYSLDVFQLESPGSAYQTWNVKSGIKAVSKSFGCSHCKDGVATK